MAPLSETEPTKAGQPLKFKSPIEFAPVRIPLKRRLQTFSVLVWFLLQLILPAVGIILTIYLLFFTKYGYIVVLPYLFWIWYDRDSCNRGGRKFLFVRKLPIWNYYRDYFPIKLIKTADLDPSKNYLFGYHPHGILCSGAFSCFHTESHNLTELFPGMRFHCLTLELNFKFPLGRDLLLAFGGCAATRSGMNHLLSTPGGGTVAVLVPGGAPEALDSHPGSYIVQLKRRKGFIKVALQNGSDLVPCISFGETDIYETLSNPKGSWFRRFQEKAEQTIKVAPVPFFGRGIFQYTFGMLPQRRPITVVVASPIPVKKIANPSQKDIDELHQKYVDTLVKIFYEYRDQYAADKSQEIMIV